MPITLRATTRERKRIHLVYHSAPLPGEPGLLPARINKVSNLSKSGSATNKVPPHLAFSSRIWEARGAHRRSLRSANAPVGMTNLFAYAKYSFQDELSSRTRISCHAAQSRSFG
jgi:hypothetical protein